VASTSTNGPCCANSANSNSGTTTITKTMFETSRGDALVNAVCTTWTGAAPGTPTNDPFGAPEMVPRTFQSLSNRNLQHFLATSPGADVLRPATSHRHLRWSQAGSRVWALVGLVLLATDGPAPASDAGPPDTNPDMGTAPIDTGAPGPIDMTGPMDGGPPAPDVGGGETAPVPEGDAGRDGTQTGGPGGNPDGAAPSDGKLPDGAAPGTDAEGRTITSEDLAWRVGCACDVGAGHNGGVPAVVVLFLALLGRRAARRS